jgi:hypothetical protein
MKCFLSFFVYPITLIENVSARCSYSAAKWPNLSNSISFITSVVVQVELVVVVVVVVVIIVVLVIVVAVVVVAI